MVLGADGMLGSDVVAEFRQLGWDVVAPLRDEVDITKAEDLEHVRVRDFGNLDWIVNCAAYTNVDKAEDEFYEASAANGIAPGILAYICARNGWRFLHISTDFVFDGESDQPYQEGYFPKPLGKYGMTKLMGERNAAKENPDAIICRTAWLYGPTGSSFPRTIIKAWLDGKELRVVDDQIGSPTYTGEMARVMADMIQADLAGGLYHAAGPDAMTWYHLALLALETYRDSVLGESREIAVEAIGTEEWPTSAPRPKYSVLSSGKLFALGVSPMRSTQACLVDFCRRLPRIL